MKSKSDDLEALDAGRKRVEAKLIVKKKQIAERGFVMSGWVSESPIPRRRDCVILKKITKRSNNSKPETSTKYFPGLNQDALKGYV